MRMRRPLKTILLKRGSVSGAQSGSFRRASGHCVSSSAIWAAAHQRTAFSRPLLKSVQAWTHTFRMALLQQDIAA